MDERTLKRLGMELITEYRKDRIENGEGYTKGLDLFKIQ